MLFTWLVPRCHYRSSGYRLEVFILSQNMAQTFLMARLSCSQFSISKLPASRSSLASLFLVSFPLSESPSHRTLPELTFSFQSKQFHCSLSRSDLRLVIPFFYTIDSTFQLVVLRCSSFSRIQYSVLRTVSCLGP